MSLRDKFGTARADFGEGSFVKQMPTTQTEKYTDFSGGYFAGDAREDAPPNTTPGGTDVEVDRKDRIVRAPGTSLFEALVGHTPNQMMLHAGLDYRSEILLFEAPNIGFKREGATTWVAAGLPAGDPVEDLFFGATYGDDFIFSNGAGSVYKHTFGTDTVEADAAVPLGKNMAVWAGRLWVAGAIIEGNFEVLGIDWSGVNNYNDREALNGAGNELLIQDTGLGDRMIALRPMGFDYMAILNRRSIWIARRVADDVFRPADFIPRVTGKGCVAERTAKTTFGGVLYLSDEGVELFDGNESHHLSEQIDAELVPLDYANIQKYSASFNPQTQRYYLTVPGGPTFVYDILRKRWFKRTQIALDVLPFAKQFHAATWGEMAGTWGATTGTWKSYLPKELDQPAMIFLGTKDDGSYHLEQEDVLSSSYFGRAQSSIWIFPVKEQDNDLGLISSHEMRVSYEQAGLIGIQLRDIEGDLLEVGTSVLPQADKPRVKRIKGSSTGKGVGPAIRLQDSDLPAPEPVGGSSVVIDGVPVNINPYHAAESFGGDFQSDAGVGPSSPITLSLGGRGARSVSVSQVTGGEDDHLVPNNDYLLGSGTVFSVDGIPMSINPCFVPPNSAPGGQFSSRADTAASTPITVLFTPPVGKTISEVRLTCYNMAAGSWMRAYDVDNNLLGEVQFGYVGGVGALAPDGIIGWVNSNGDHVDTPYSRKVLTVAGIRKVVLTPPAANFVTYGQFNFKTQSASGVGKMEAFNSKNELLGSVNFDAVPGVLTTSNKTLTAAGIVKVILTPAAGTYVVYKTLTIVTEVNQLRISKVELDFRLRSPRIDNGVVTAPVGRFGDFV